MRQYFIHNGQNEEGPFDINQLKTKNLKKDTPVWYEGLQSWTTMSEVEELKTLFTPTPPPLTNKADTVIPPKLTQQNISTQPTQTPYSAPTPKKSSATLQLIIGGVIVVGAIIGWLVYKNSQHSSTIDTLQNQVSTQEQTIQTQQSADAEKEAERQRINQAVTAKNMNFRNNWQNYIKVSNGEPTVDYTFGGISEFNVFVDNQTSYLLDQVDVYVQYIRKNGDIAQDKTISIFNVPAGSSEIGVAPSSVNGIKVSCSIIKIISKKMHFCYPSDNGNPEDPYFCK